MATENPVARRAAILIANTTGTPEEIAAALDAAGVLVRPPVKVVGPYPLWVRATGLGAAVDAHPIVSALVRALAAESVEAPEEVATELAAIGSASGPAADALVEELLERLGGTEARYGATAARHMAAALLQAAGPEFPLQQDRQAA